MFRNFVGGLDSNIFDVAIAIHAPPDVRPIIKAYHGKDIPRAYAAVEAEQKRKVIEEWEKSRKTGGSGSMAIGGLFGFGGATKSVRSLPRIRTLFIKNTGWIF